MEECLSPGSKRRAAAEGGGGNHAFHGLHLFTSAEEGSRRREKQRALAGALAAQMEEKRARVAREKEEKRRRDAEERREEEEAARSPPRPARQHGGEGRVARSISPVGGTRPRSRTGSPPARAYGAVAAHANARARPPREGRRAEPPRTRPGGEGWPEVRSPLAALERMSSWRLPRRGRGGSGGGRGGGGGGRSAVRVRSPPVHVRSPLPHMLAQRRQAVAPLSPLRVRSPPPPLEVGGGEEDRGRGWDISAAFPWPPAPHQLQQQEQQRYYRAAQRPGVSPFGASPAALSRTGSAGGLLPCASDFVDASHRPEGVMQAAAAPGTAGAPEVCSPPAGPPLQLVSPASSDAGSLPGSFRFVSGYAGELAAAEGVEGAVGRKQSSPAAAQQQQRHQVRPALHIDIPGPASPAWGVGELTPLCLDEAAPRQGGGAAMKDSDLLRRFLGGGSGEKSSHRLVSSPPVRA